MIEELEEAIDAQQAYWWLSLNNEKIEPASYLQTFFNYVHSFFSDSHRQALSNRFLQVLKEVPVDTIAYQIALEKIAALQGKGFWGNDLPIKLPELSPLLYTTEVTKPFPHQILPYEENGRFYNYPNEGIWTQLLETLRLLFVGTMDAASHLDDLHESFHIAAAPTLRNETDDPLVTWIGHACVLIQVAGMNLLFDPSFGFIFPCFIRHVDPGIPKKKLPLIDALFLSHNHGDHSNQADTFASYNPVVFAGDRSGEWLKNMGFERVAEHGWWQTTTLSREGKEIRITAVPAQHGSSTGINDINYMLWCGYVIEVEGKTLYFSGDTAMGHELVDRGGERQKLFAQICEQFGPIDLAFLPIAPQNEPRVHIDEEQALAAMRELEAKMMIPIHWGAYRTGSEQIEKPIQLLLEKAGDLKERIHILKMGEPFLYRQQSSFENRA